MFKSILCLLLFLEHKLSSHTNVLVSLEAYQAVQTKHSFLLMHNEKAFSTISLTNPHTVSHKEKVNISN